MPPTSENTSLPVMCIVRDMYLDDAQGGRGWLEGWLENTSPLEMAMEELPLGPPVEVPTANRDQRSGEEFAM
jgi:hypothetical protein